MLLPAWARVSPGRAAHIARVVRLAEQWALERGVSVTEAERWSRAALLHDALKDAQDVELARWVPRGDWPPKLWHGPAAAAAAEAHGEVDEGVLDAIRYHSLGYAGWDDAGRILYLADFLEPGRKEDRERRDAWIARVPGDLDGVFFEVVAQRVGFATSRGYTLRKETLDLWNQLAAGDSPPQASLPSA